MNINGGVRNYAAGETSGKERVRMDTSIPIDLLFSDCGGIVEV